MKMKTIMAFIQQRKKRAFCDPERANKMRFFHFCTVTKGDLPIKIWWTLSESYESIAEYNITSNDGIIISNPIQYE